jgi:hypothetical protein
MACFLPVDGTSYPPHHAVSGGGVLGDLDLAASA